MKDSLDKIYRFSKRMYEFMKVSGFRNSNELSTHLGYKHSEKISRLFRGSKYKPSYRTLLDIAEKFPTLNLNWLITGKGEMFHTSQLSSSNQSKEQLIKEKSAHFIPLYDSVATKDGHISFWEQESHILDLIPKKFGMRDCDLAIHAYGTNMHPMYTPGDIILLKEIKNHKLINFGRVYVVVTEEHCFIKYAAPAKSASCLLLRSANNHYGDIEVEKAQILRLYQVQGSFRRAGI